MSNYTITTPNEDVVRIEFQDGWDAESESMEMFKTLVSALDDCEDEVNLLIVAGDLRPSYKNNASAPAHDVLFHENIKQILVVAKGASYAASHMGAVRGKRGLKPIPILAFDTEAEAEASLKK